MRRKVLIDEQTDTLRSIAENVLRQNGYEVIAVTAAEKAREVLELSQPDLIIVGADLAAPDGTLYHERLRQEPKTSKMILRVPVRGISVVPLIRNEVARNAANSDHIHADAVNFFKPR